MTQLETRYPCPVCLGATLQKSVVKENPLLTIDHCARCGGVWFDYGEVQQLRRCEPKVLWELVAQHAHVHQMQCRGCQAYLSRNDHTCSGCGRKNELECPRCGRALHLEAYHDWRFDACTECRGVWFDRHELDAIWRIEVNALTEARQQKFAAGQATRDGGLVLLDALAFDPWLTFYGVHALGQVASGGVNVIGSVPEIAGGVGDVVAEAAGSVFETIAEIIGSIFG
jgi:Zn-finger nucleic acid-binding protein